MRKEKADLQIENIFCKKSVLRHSFTCIWLLSVLAICRPILLKNICFVSLSLVFLGELLSVRMGSEPCLIIPVLLPNSLLHALRSCPELS